MLLFQYIENNPKRYCEIEQCGNLILYKDRYVSQHYKILNIMTNKNIYNTRFLRKAKSTFIKLCNTKSLTPTPNL